MFPNNIPVLKSALALIDPVGFMAPHKVLRHAIAENLTDVVHLLLKKGWNPEGGDIYGDICGRHDAKLKSTMDLARKKSDIWYLLRDAIQKKIDTEGEDYKVPRRYVWNSRKQKDVIVAYSFTAPEL